MKRSLIVILAILVIAAAAVAADEGRFFTYPTIHSDTIVFTYESDLWSVAAKGGVAARLTTFPGTESFAKLSPDGKWLAFTATYDGAAAVYLMPSEGGAPVRLTYNPGGAQVVAWTPDGSEIVFRSSFENVVGRDPNLFSVGVKGGAPVRLPLDRGVLVSFIPEKHQFLFCRRGNEEYYWKRYKGGQYQDIWLYDAAAKTYTPVTDYVGKNSYPMWVGGLMYFVSDRGNGISNLYTQKLGTKDAAPVTKYDDFDVMMPHTDGRSIVYVQDGRIHVLDVASGADTRISVKVPSDRWALRDRVINPKDYIQTAGVADGGQAVVLAARGDVFRVPTGRGPAENLSGTPGTREMYPALSPDGKTVAFFSDRSGDYQLYTQPAAGGDWTQITTGLDRTVYKLLWSPDGRKILFGNKDYAIFWVDLATKKLVKADSSNQMKNDEFTWEIARLRLVARLPVDRLQLRPGQPQQPDLPLRHRDREEDRSDDRLLRQPLPGLRRERRLPLLRLEPELRPAHGFLRGQPRHRDPPAGHGRPAPGRRGPALRRRARREGRQEGRAPCPSASTRRAWSSGPSRCPSPPATTSTSRPGRARSSGSRSTSSPRTNTRTSSSPRARPSGRSTSSTWPAARTRPSTARSATSRCRPTASTLLVRRDADVFTTAVDKAFASKSAGDKLDLAGLVYKVDLQKEWHQIFNDAWRWYRDFFYDAGIARPRLEGHGRQVPGLHPRAVLAGRAQLGPVPDGRRAVRLAHLRRRRRLRARRDTRPRPVFTGLLGADLVADKASGLYKLARIYGPTDINLNLTGPLVRPDIAVKEGDYLLAIDGAPLKAGDDYFKLLQTTAGKKIKVTVNAAPSMTGAKTYEIEPVRSDAQMRYFRWIDDNIKAIDKATGGPRRLHAHQRHGRRRHRRVRQVLAGLPI